MVSFQFMDDLRDWRTDLAQGNYTPFLTRVMAQRDLDPAIPLTETEVDKALFAGAVLDEYLELVADPNRRVPESASSQAAPHLRACLTLFDQRCEQLEITRSERIPEPSAALIQEAPVPSRESLGEEARWEQG
jgi:hypothetical protein